MQILEVNLRKMWTRLSLLILILVCVAEIRSETHLGFHGQESSASLNGIIDDDRYLHPFATRLIEFLKNGKENGNWSDNIDIHQKLDFAKTLLLSKRGNSTDIPYWNEQIEILEMAQKILESNFGNVQKEKGIKEDEGENFESSIPSVTRSIVIENDETLKDHIPKQSQKINTMKSSKYSTSNERLGVTEISNKLVFDADSKYTKGVIGKPTDSNNSDTLAFANTLLHKLSPGKLETNSSHLNVTSTAQKPANFPPVGEVSPLNKDEILSDSVPIVYDKITNLEMLINNMNILIQNWNKKENPVTLDKHTFSEFSSSSHLTSGIESNMTDHIRHQSESDQKTGVNNSDLTMSNTFHNAKEVGTMIFPLRSVSSVFDDRKEGAKRSGKAHDFSNDMEHTADSSTELSSVNSTFNDSEIQFKKQYPWSKNFPHTFIQDRNENRSMKTEAFQSPIGSKNYRESIIPKITSYSNYTSNSKVPLSNVTEPQTKSLGNRVPEKINYGHDEEATSKILSTNISVNKEVSNARDKTEEYAGNMEENTSVLRPISTHETNFGRSKDALNKKDFETGNITEFTTKTWRDHGILQNRPYSDLFKILTGTFEREPAANYGDSITNGKMVEKLDEIVKIQKSIENLYSMFPVEHENKPAYNSSIYADGNIIPEIVAREFSNENNQSLRDQTKLIRREHSNKVSYSFYAPVLIQINNYINDNNTKKVNESALMNSQIEYSKNNENIQLDEGKDSGRKTNFSEIYIIGDSLKFDKDKSMIENQKYFPEPAETVKHVANVSTSNEAII